MSTAFRNSAAFGKRHFLAGDFSRILTEDPDATAPVQMGVTSE